MSVIQKQVKYFQCSKMLLEHQKGQLHACNYIMLYKRYAGGDTGPSVLPFGAIHFSWQVFSLPLNLLWLI